MDDQPRAKNTRPYTLRMPEELYKRLAKRAIDEGTRMNEFVNDLLRRALEETPPDDEGRQVGEFCHQPG